MCEKYAFIQQNIVDWPILIKVKRERYTVNINTVNGG